MSASPASGSDHGSHEPHPHPPTPAVYDEAADTPTWVPVTGLVLFLVITLYVVFRSAMAPVPTPGADTTDEAYAGEQAPAPEAPPAQ